MTEPLIEIVAPTSYPGVVAEEVAALVQDRIKSVGSCSLVLAGGKTPSAIYRKLARPPFSSDIPWDKVRLYWGDERWVPADDVRSNYNMVRETLLDDLKKNSSLMPQVFPIDTSLNSIADSAKAYGDIIKENEVLNDDGIPVFDIVLLGIGEDCHTASLFPGTKAIDDTGVCTVGENPEDTTERVSLSVGTLCAARRLIFMVRGENKAEPLYNILHGSASIKECPARLYANSQGRVTWFVDTPAGSRLKK